MYTGRKLFYVNRRSQIKVPASGGHFEEKSAEKSPHPAGCRRRIYIAAMKKAAPKSGLLSLVRE